MIVKKSNTIISNVYEENNYVTTNNPHFDE